MTNSEENFADLFEQNIAGVKSYEKQVVKGLIINIDNNFVTFDVGLKSEGRVDINEFKDNENNLPTMQVGDYVDVYIDRYEDDNGNIILSREKAIREETWYKLQKCLVNEDIVNGFISKRVRGGFAVLVDNVPAFLPGSQLDIRPVKNGNFLINTTVPLKILKMDQKRYNIIVSRRAVLLESEENSGIANAGNFEEGQVVEGTIKNITGYGVFVDLGAIDGLLHITDISWSRINHPSEVVSLGDTMKFKIIKIHPDTRRISLGLKQLQEDPWSILFEKYQLDSVHQLPISSLVPYGLFLSLSNDVDGLVHISELSWTKKDINPERDFELGNIVEIKVIEVDHQKRRINLSVKRCFDNPWENYALKNPENSLVDVVVKVINNSGIVVSLNSEIDGFIRNSDIAWSESEQTAEGKYVVGDTIKAKIIKIQLEKDKILLGIKQLEDTPIWEEATSLKKGDTIVCKIKEINSNGLDVEVLPDVPGFIKQTDLSMDRMEQRLTNFNVNDSIKAVIIHINTFHHMVYLSIKAFEALEYKKIMKESQNISGDNTLASALSDALDKKENK